MRTGRSSARNKLSCWLLLDLPKPTHSIFILRQNNQISTTCWYSGTMTWAFGFITRNVSACFVPTGQRENSPAFQRREKRRTTSVPQGRLNGRQIVSTVTNHCDLKTSTVHSGLVIVSRLTRR